MTVTRSSVSVAVLRLRMAGVAIYCAAILEFILTAAWAQPTSCDVNRDGKVDVLDVQLITNMEIGAPGFPCTVNIGGVLGCSESARQVVMKAALGRGCHFNYLTWRPASGRVTGYNLYRMAADGGPRQLLNTRGPISGTKFADVDAAPGRKYRYFVKAWDGSKELDGSIGAAVMAK